MDEFDLEAVATDAATPVPLQADDAFSFDTEAVVEEPRMKREDIKDNIPELDSGSFRDYMAAYDISLSTSHEERANKVKYWYPQGDIKYAGADTFIRKDAKSDYQPISGTMELGASIINPSNIGAWVGGDVGAKAGAMLAPIPSTVIAGSAAGAGLGATAGNYLEYLYDKSRNISPASNMPFGDWTAVTGKQDDILWAVGGEGAGRIIEKGIKWFVPMASREAKQLSREAEDIGLKPLMRGEVSQNPLTETRFRQTLAIDAGARKKFLDQLKSVRDVLRSTVDQYGFSAFNNKNLEKLVAAEQATLYGIMDARRVGLIPGQILIDGLEGFKNSSKELVDRNYKRLFDFAEGIPDISYDISEVRKVAKDMKFGIWGRGPDKEVTETFMNPATGELEEITKTVPSTVMITQLPGEVQSVINKIIKLNDELEEVTKTRTIGGTRITKSFNPVVQLRAMRKLVGDLTDHEAREVSEPAKALYAKLTDSFQNPIGLTSSEAAKYKSYFNSANKSAKWRLSNLDDAYVFKALNTDAPGKVANNIFKPNNYDRIYAAKKVLRFGGEDTWDRLKEAYIARLQAKPERIQNVIESFKTDPKSFDLIFTKGEQAQLALFGETARKLNSSGIKKLFDKDLVARDKVKAFVERGKESDFQNLVDLAGGKDTPEAKSLKAGVALYILEKSTFPSGKELGDDVLDPQIFKETVKKLKESGVLDPLFDAADWKRLDTLNRYTTTLSLSGGPDLQASLKAGTIATARAELGVKTILGEGYKAFERYLIPLTSYALMARSMTSPVTDRLLSEEVGGGFGTALRYSIRSGNLVYQDMKAQSQEKGQ